MGSATFAYNIVGGNTIYVVFTDSGSASSCTTPSISDTFGDTFSKTASSCNVNSGKFNYGAIWKASVTETGIDTVDVTANSITGGVLGIMEVVGTITSTSTSSSSGSSSTTPGTYSLSGITGFSGNGVLIGGVSETGGGACCTANTGWDSYGTGNWAIGYSGYPSNTAEFKMTSATGGVTGWVALGVSLHTT